MATSARDLLEELHQRTGPNPAPLDSTRADDALTAADTLGRVLDWLAADGVHPDRSHPRSHAVHGLARAVRHISPHPPSPAVVRLTDLAGAVADLTALQRDNYDAAERWSTAVAVAEAIQACVDYARRRPEHYDAAIYQTIHTPPLPWPSSPPPTLPTHSAAPCSTPRPPPQPQASVSPSPPTPHPPWPSPCVKPTDTAASASPTVSPASPPATPPPTTVNSSPSPRSSVTDQDAPDSDPSWRYAARAWQQVHRSLNSFDDGTRIRHTSATAIAGAAVQLHHGLRDQLGVDASTDTLRGRHDVAEIATALRQIANHLPVIADQLTRAVAHWGGTGQLTALASNLPHTGRSLDAYLHRRIVTVDLADLTPTLTALRHARTLAIHLAGELHQSAGKLGVQPQPYLAHSYRLRQEASTTGHQVATLITTAAATPRQPWHTPTRGRAR